MTNSFWQLYGEAVMTAFGFFWKAGWAFVFGYFVNSMILTGGLLSRGIL